VDCKNSESFYTLNENFGEQPEQQQPQQQQQRVARQRPFVAPEVDQQVSML